jgi:hypothetical protein
MVDQKGGAIGRQHGQTQYGVRTPQIVTQIASLDEFVVVGRAKGGEMQVWSSADERTTRDFLREAAPQLAGITEPA